MVRSFFYIFLLNVKVKVCNTCLVVKTVFCMIITLLSWFLVTENKHLSRDPQPSSVTLNCQIYIMQLDTVKTGIFKLKEIMSFMIVRRNILLNNLICSFVSPTFRFKETRSVNFFTDPELSNCIPDFTNVLSVHNGVSKWQP